MYPFPHALSTIVDVYNCVTHKGCLQTLHLKCAFVRADLVIEVAQATVALGGAVELCDLWDVEAGGEFLPDGLTKAVTEGHADLVFVLRGLLWLIQQIAADLANVLNDLRHKIKYQFSKLPLSSISMQNININNIICKHTTITLKQRPESPGDIY